MKKSEILLTMVAMAMILPMMNMIIMSFTAGQSVYVMEGFSFRHYLDLFQNTDAQHAITLSLQLLALTVVGGTLLGTCCAFALKAGGWGTKTLLGGLLVMLTMPEVATGFSLTMLFNQLNIDNGLMTMWMGQLVTVTPFVTFLVYAKLKEMPPSLVMAAQDMGVSPLRTLCHVVLPFIRPSVVSGALLSAALSIDDFVVSSMLSGPESTNLPQFIYNSVRLGVTPEINALATCMLILITIIAVIAAKRHQRP